MAYVACTCEISRETHTIIRVTCKLLYQTAQAVRKAGRTEGTISNFKLKALKSTYPLRLTVEKI